MKLDAWLGEATKGLPASVRSRLQNEYAAHLEDADADALSLFGPPEQVRREFRRLYLSESGLSWRVSGYSIGMLVNLVGVLLLFALTLMLPLSFWLLLALPTLAASLFGGAYLATRRLEVRQRPFVMDMVCLLLCYALPLGLALMDDQMTLPGWSLALLALGSAGGSAMLWHEGRFRRTLAIEGAA